MTPKLICENYQCKLGADREVRVFGLTEYGGTRTDPDEFIAIVHTRGQLPKKLETDSFDGIVAMLARAVGEPEDDIRKALATRTAILSQ